MLVESLVLLHARAKMGTPISTLQIHALNFFWKKNFQNVITPRHPARSPLLLLLFWKKENLLQVYQLILVRYATLDIRPTLARGRGSVSSPNAWNTPLAMSMRHHCTERIHCTIHYCQCSNVNSKETQENLGLIYDKLHDKSVAISLPANNEAHILK